MLTKQISDEENNHAENKPLYTFICRCNRIKIIKPITMLMKKEETFCLACELPLKGRIDKKYCDDYCKSAFYNSLKSPTTKFVRNINNALSKNRRILENLYARTSTDEKMINRENMLQEGFQFKYLTHTIPQPQQIPIYCCYDYGYKLLHDDCYLIIQLQQEKNI